MSDSDRPLRKSARTKRRIYHAAFDLFEEHGFDDTSIEQIVDRAGIGRRTFFRHFAQKESLLFDQETFEPMIAEFRAVLYAEGDPAIALVRTLQNPFHFPADDTELARRRRRLRSVLRGHPRIESYYTAFLDRAERSLIDVCNEWELEASRRGHRVRPFATHVVPGLWRSLSLHHVDSGEDHHYEPDLARFIPALAELATRTSAAWESDSTTEQ